jgi:hypothetical protein
VLPSVTGINASAGDSSGSGGLCKKAFGRARSQASIRGPEHDRQHAVRGIWECEPRGEGTHLAAGLYLVEALRLCQVTRLLAAVPLPSKVWPARAATAKTAKGTCMHCRTSLARHGRLEATLSTIRPLWEYGSFHMPLALSFLKEGLQAKHCQSIKVQRQMDLGPLCTS